MNTENPREKTQYPIKVIIGVIVMIFLFAGLTAWHVYEGNTLERLKLETFHHNFGCYPNENTASFRVMKKLTDGMERYKEAKSNFAHQKEALLTKLTKNLIAPNSVESKDWLEDQKVLAKQEVALTRLKDDILSLVNQARNYGFYDEVEIVCPKDSYPELYGL